jgi:hypothetical protein
MKSNTIESALHANGYPCGRMISGSKSFYSTRHPDSFVIFNANIISKNYKEKVWYGDLDLTEDFDKLKELAQESGDIFYFLREMDCRFDEEDAPFKELVKRSKWDTTKDRAPVYEDNFNS